MDWVTCGLLRPLRGDDPVIRWCGNPCVSCAGELRFGCLNEADLRLGLLIADADSLYFRLRFRHAERNVRRLRPNFANLKVLCRTNSRMLLGDHEGVRSECGVDVAKVLAGRLLRLMALNRSSFLQVVRMSRVQIPIVVTVLTRREDVENRFRSVSIALRVARVGALYRDTIWFVVTVYDVLTRVRLQDLAIMVVMMVLVVSGPS